MLISGATSLSELTPEIEQIIRRHHTNEKLEPISDERLQEIFEQMKGIRAYAQETFFEESRDILGNVHKRPIDLLSDEEICALVASIRSPHPSPEQAIIAKQDGYMEIRRALSRSYCLYLLLKGDEGYEDFVANQEKDNPFLPVLSREDYHELSNQFRQKTPLSIACLRVSTLISSVPLSEEAKKQANKYIGTGKYILDSVEFPATVFEDIKKAKFIYPLINTLFNQYPDSADQISFHLKNHFPHGTHYRHQTYTEGSQNMFVPFVQGVRAGTLSKAAYEDWRDYWTINITGFRGQVNPKGSLYLTENTYRGMKALESTLEEVFTNEKLTPKDILNHYLAQRAFFLELDIEKKGRAPLTSAEQNMLAHIGAMLRLYHPREGDLLVAGYLCCKEIVEELADLYFETPDSEPTPTYAPAFFANAVGYRLQQYDHDSVLQKVKQHPDKQTITEAENLKRMLAHADTVVACLPLYLIALREYRKKRAEGTISAQQPLSFQSIAGVKEITELLGKSPIIEKINILDFVAIEIDAKASVTYKKLPKFEERLNQFLQQGSAQPTSLAQALSTPAPQPEPSLVLRYKAELERESEIRKHQRTGSLSPTIVKRLKVST